MAAFLTRSRDYRDVEYADNTKANFVACTDSDGHSFVDVELRQQADQGRGAFLRTDLDTLKDVIRRGDEIMRSPEGVGAAFADERINGHAVTFIPSPTRGQPTSLDIRLEKSEGQNRQSAAQPLHRLKSIMRDGEDVEKELEYDQKRYYLVVRVNSVERESDGRMKATVYESVKSPSEGQRLVKDHEGSLALYSEPKRKFLDKETDIEVRPEERLELFRGTMRTVEGQAVHNEMRGERKSEHFVVAKWNYPDRSPIKGEQVVWDGNGEEYNGSFAHYTAKPVGGQDKGMAVEEQYVLIRIKGFAPGEELPPGHGKIEASSPVTRDMTAALALSEIAERNHRAVSTDWNQQTLGMVNKGPQY